VLDPRLTPWGFIFHPGPYNSGVQRLNRLLELIPELLASGLVDMSGGNFAIRTGRGICVSPTQAGEKLRWQLSPDDFVLFPGEGDASMARGGRRPSRDNRVHRAVLAACPEWNFLYHGHPWGLLGFALAKQPLPVPAAHAGFFGGRGPRVVPLVPEIPPGTAELAEQAAKVIFEEFKDCQCGAVLLGGHGPLVAGVEVDSTLSLAQVLESLARAQHWRLDSSTAG
jgi:ribulose-5-phosphate 4-epimerase/fuculose-1-phosphate aldolase